MAKPNAFDTPGVFITGGSRGIGHSMAVDFAANGYAVAFTYNSSEERAQTVIEEAQAAAKAAGHDRPIKAYKCDVRDSGQVEATVEQAIDDLETITCGINNAGINKNNFTAFMSDEEWFDVLNTNLSGAFFVSRQLITHFMQNKYGRLLHISSLAHQGTTGQINYSASKAGLHGMSKCIAKEYGRKKITSNILIPGVFLTDMTKENLSQELEDFWKTFCPAKRFGEMEDLTQIAMFLASPQGSFINGEEIHVTGGLTYAP